MINKFWKTIKHPFYLLFKVFPKAPDVNAKWGIFQLFLTIALFLIGTSFAMLQIPSINNWIGFIVFLIAAFLFLVYSVFLGFNYYQSGKKRKDYTVILPKIDRKLNKMINKIDEIYDKLQPKS